MFQNSQNFSFEPNIASFESLYASELMISDWSGAALDYAFGLERPVLFVDIPLKLNNPDWQELKINPLEAHIRDQIGTIISVENLSDAPGLVRRLCAEPAAFAEQIRAARSRCIFNVRTSGKRAATQLVGLMSER